VFKLKHLQALVELSQGQGDAIPGLVYEADLKYFNNEIYYT